MDAQHRTRILLSIMSTPQQVVNKRGDDGEQFDCLAHHFNGAGLLEITSQFAESQNYTTFRFSKYGDLIGAFLRSINGEDQLLYDCGSGYSSEDDMEEQGVLLLERLALTITAEEDMNYYL